MTENQRMASVAVHTPPSFFVPNRGQFHPSVKFYTRCGNMRYYFAHNQITCQIPLEESGHYLGLLLCFDEAQKNSTLAGFAETDAKQHDFKGNNLEAWASGLPTFRQIAYQQIWHGVYLNLVPKQTGVEFNWVVDAHSSPQAISLCYKGATKLTLDDKGQLVIEHEHGHLTDPKPVAFQWIDGIKCEVPCYFELCEQNSLAFGFAVASSYNSDYPLILEASLLGGCNPSQSTTCD